MDCIRNYIREQGKEREAEILKNFHSKSANVLLTCPVCRGILSVADVKSVFGFRSYQNFKAMAIEREQQKFARKVEEEDKKAVEVRATKAADLIVLKCCKKVAENEGRAGKEEHVDREIIREYILSVYKHLPTVGIIL